MSKIIKKVATNKVRDIAVSYLLKAAGVASGFWGFVAGIAAKYLWKLAVKLGIKYENKIEEKIETAKELKTYDEKINKPDASPEDIKQAGKDFLNS